MTYNLSNRDIISSTQISYNGEKANHTNFYGNLMQGKESGSVKDNSNLGNSSSASKDKGSCIPGQNLLIQPTTTHSSLSKTQNINISSGIDHKYNISQLTQNQNLNSKIQNSGNLSNEVNDQETFQIANANI